tara:strand:+ start:2853 stop:3110 length:258 start_codon:yes stop_codon:yes gene_type:complete
MENVMSVDNTTTQENDKHVYKKPDGGEIHCYGSVEWDSNFHVCCDDEEFDGVVVDCDGETYDTWDKVCAYLMKEYRQDLEEITAV